eukprot:SAG22_NODE_15949_length_336_cov_0.658228_1_plen_52_part_10
MIIRADGVRAGATGDEVRRAFERFGTIDQVALVRCQDEEGGGAAALVTFHLD